MLQTNKQTNKQTDSNILPTPTESVCSVDNNDQSDDSCCMHTSKNRCKY